MANFLFSFASPVFQQPDKVDAPAFLRMVQVGRPTFHGSFEEDLAAATRHHAVMAARRFVPAH